MTTEEAMACLSNVEAGYRLFANEAYALKRVLAELARVTAERDRLIEAWPGTECGIVYLNGDSRWAVESGSGTDYDTREQAVRAAAGLNSSPAE